MSTLNEPMLAGLLAARVADLTATPEGRALFAAYLDRLETLHCGDAMRGFIARSRAALAAAETPAPIRPLEVA